MAKCHKSACRSFPWPLLWLIWPLVMLISWLGPIIHQRAWLIWQIAAPNITLIVSLGLIIAGIYLVVRQPNNRDRPNTRWE